MQTRREWIYLIRERLRAVTPDNRIPNRVINMELEAGLLLLVRRDGDSRRLWKQTNLFKSRTIDLKTIDLVSRSIVILPPLFIFNTGPALQIDGADTTPWTIGTPRLGIGAKGKYGWIMDDYLYLNKPNIDQITIRYYGKPYKELLCQSELDVLLPVPDHLEEDLKNSVVQKLMAAPLQIPEDTYPNQNALDKQGPRLQPQGSK